MSEHHVALLLAVTAVIGGSVMAMELKWRWAFIINTAGLLFLVSMAWSAEHRTMQAARKFPDWVKYVASEHSNWYHVPECKNVKDITTPVLFSDETAAAVNRAPCSCVTGHPAVERLVSTAAPATQ